MTEKARLEWQFDGRVARVILAAPKANILDRAMVAQIDAILAGLESNRDLCAIVIAADGPHFSFGASIEEHLPEAMPETLASLSNLLRRLAAAPAPTIAAVRGQCLGGGFELALGCDLIVAEDTAQMAVPEIKLGVFPPAASALLPVRLGAALAAFLVLSGEGWTGAVAKQHGLVARMAASGQLDADVEAMLRSDFVQRSPAGLRHAAMAVRRPVVRALHNELPQLDRLYLDELMGDPDAVEGIRAFLEKRDPQWRRSVVA